MQTEGDNRLQVLVLQASVISKGSSWANRHSPIRLAIRGRLEWPQTARAGVPLRRPFGPRRFPEPADATSGLLAMPVRQGEGRLAAPRGSGGPKKLSPRAGGAIDHQRA